MATWSNTNKSSDPTFFQKLRHGRDTQIGDIADKTFEDDVFGDGTALGDETFNKFQDQSYTNTSKSSDPTWSQPNRS